MIKDDDIAKLLIKNTNIRSLYIEGNRFDHNVLEEALIFNLYSEEQYIIKSKLNYVSYTCQLEGKILSILIPNLVGLVMGYISFR